jgi:DNA-binding CsgD family transcriptional regulator
MLAEIVGRDRELRALEAFLDRVPEGPVAVVIEGEAGIGKTTLWRAALSAARERGLVTLEARPGERETALSLAAVGDLLGGVLEDVLPALPDAQRQALEAALRLGADAEGPDRRTVALAFLNAVGVLAAERPVLLAVDDVQWLDPDSASVLEFAVRRLGDATVGLVVAVRAETGGPAPLGLERALPEDRIVRLAVRPLDSSALNRLLVDRLGVSFPRPTIRQISDTAAGNPFFALELGRALQREGAIRHREERLPVPATLAELVQSRLAALPEHTLAAVGATAALSQPTPELAVVAAGGEDVLAPAFSAHVLELDGDRVRFSHPLLASGALAAVPPLERRALHARLATLVDDAEERARHLALAAEGPDEAVASALEAAASRARSRGAPGAAAELYEEARRLTPSEQAEDARRRAVDAAFHHFESGDSPRAAALLEEVISSVPFGCERARALMRLARVRSYEDQEAGSLLFERAIAEAEGDRAILAVAHEGVAACLFRLRVRLEEAVEHASRAAELAGELGEAVLVAEALASRVLAESLLGSEAAAATAEAALRLQDPTAHRRLLGQPLPNVAVYWMWTDQFERAERAYLDLLSRCEETGDESSLPYVLVLLGQLECVLGKLDSAAAHAVEGRELAEQSGQRTLLAYHLALAGLADGLRGRADLARAAALRSLELVPETGGRPAELMARAALGHLELSQGNPAAAVAWLAPGAGYARAAGFGEPGAIRMVVDLVEALIESGETVEATDVLRWYEGHARRLGRVSALAACNRCRGLLAAAAGDLGGAVDAFERGLADHERIEVPLDRARTLLALGATQRRMKRKRAARETLEQARDLCERLGAEAWAERTRAELRRISGRAPASDELTPVERRIATLVTEGRTNREIGSALFLSDRTVEGHLTRIYAKLSVRSRTELTRLVGAERPPDDA